MKKNIFCFSGGKDSTAMVLWSKEHRVKNAIYLFCDTKFEHDMTYKYIDFINKKVLNNELIVIKSEKYDGFEDLSIKKQRLPSVMARFCTEELKIIPMQKFVASFDYNCNVFVGIRAEESAKRAKLAVSHWDEIYNCRVYRPLLRWTYDMVFAIHKKHGIEPNPLYKMGLKRVSCIPCIMTNNKELGVINKLFPEYIDKVRKLEKIVGRSFYAGSHTPDWATPHFDPKSGHWYAWIDDVLKYIEKNPNQLEIFDAPSCMSYYGLCE